MIWGGTVEKTKKFGIVLNTVIIDRLFENLCEMGTKKSCSYIGLLSLCFSLQYFTFKNLSK